MATQILPRSASPRKPRRTAKTTKPAWFDEVSRFLARLNLSPSGLMGVCRFLDATESAEGCPVLLPEHVRTLGVILARHNGKIAPAKPDAIQDRIKSVLGVPAPVATMPDAS